MRVSNRQGEDGYADYMRLKDQGAYVEVRLNGELIICSVADEERGEVWRVSRDDDGGPITYRNATEYEILKGKVEITVMYPANA